MLASEAREIRGYILVLCKHSYPYGCSEQLIGTFLAQSQFSCSPAEIKGHLEYLEEKGYIRMEELRVDKLKLHRVVAYITAKGIDLLEGSIPSDPGIMLPGEM
jgi:DNA-binding PadR family transcriptional regulator